MLIELVKSMYLGERCKYCGREYRTMEDLERTVYAGYHQHGRLACSSCWKLNHRPWWWTPLATAFMLLPLFIILIGGK